MDSILDCDSGCFDIAAKVGSFSDFGSIVGLNVASAFAEDYYVLCFDFGGDRSIPADSDLMVRHFDTALDVTVQIQIFLAEYSASDSDATVNNDRSGRPETGFFSGQS
jgi:hypothetical protein